MTASAGGEIDIPALGQIEFASAAAPARFDLLLDETGSYAVRRDGGDEIATIVVSEPDAAAKQRPAAGKSGSGS